jgi:hypothetical protein
MELSSLPPVEVATRPARRAAPRHVPAGPGPLGGAGQRSTRPARHGRPALRTAQPGVPAGQGTTGTAACAPGRPRVDSPRVQRSRRGRRHEHGGRQRRRSAGSQGRRRVPSRGGHDRSRPGRGQGHRRRRRRGRGRRGPRGRGRGRRGPRGRGRGRRGRGGRSRTKRRMLRRLLTCAIGEQRQLTRDPGRDQDGEPERQGPPSPAVPGRAGRITGRAAAGQDNRCRGGIGDQAGRRGTVGGHDASPGRRTAADPGTASPSAADPGTASPSTASPGTASPGTASPGTGGLSGGLGQDLAERPAGVLRDQSSGRRPGIRSRGQHRAARLAKPRAGGTAMSLEATGPHILAAGRAGLRTRRKGMTIRAARHRFPLSGCQPAAGEGA